MLSNIISPRDQTLLKEVEQLLARNDPPLCPDFYQFLDSIDANAPPKVARIFNQLLLGDLSDLIKFIHTHPALGANTIIQLFNLYSACLARRVPMIVSDANQARMALEAIRKLCFAVLQELFPEHLYLHTEENLSFSSQAELSTKSANVIDNELFIANTNQWIKQADNQPNIVVIAVRFEFNVESAKMITAVIDQIALRLREAIRKEDLIVQFSMRRWAICLPNIDSENLAILAVNKIQRLFESVFIHNKKPILASPFIGVALADKVLNEASKLLTAAFKSAINAQNSNAHYAVYDVIKELETKRLLRMAEDLKIAIFENDLELYFQPKYSISQKKIIGLEALLRWNRPQGQANLASVFEVIEKNDLLEAFTTWLFQTAFRHLKTFIQHGMDIKLSINIVPQNLNNPNFIHELQNIIKIWTPPLERVIIEITEGSMMSDAQHTIQALTEIKQLGLKLSLDDFGTGYSSLSYLSRLPIQEIKIDQSFVKSMFNSERDEAIVRTIIELANNFKLDLVAEGVEDEKTAMHIAALGCDIIQGFWISRPISSEQLIEWFKSDQKIFGKQIHIQN